MIEVGGKFYITSRSNQILRAEDIGPYDTLEEAAQAAVTITHLNAVPAHWPRFRTPT